MNMVERRAKGKVGQVIPWGVGPWQLAVLRIHKGRRLITLLSSSNRLPKCWQLQKCLCKILPAQEGRPKKMTAVVTQQNGLMARLILPFFQSVLLMC